MYGREVTGNIELPQQQEPPVEPVSLQQAARDVEPPQMEPPVPSRDMEVWSNTATIASDHFSAVATALTY